MKKGIAVAGSLVADIVYTVDRYPEIGALTKIQDPIINNTGGAVCNTAMVLAKLDSQLPITALGKVGRMKLRSVFGKLSAIIPILMFPK